MDLDDWFILEHLGASEGGDMVGICDYLGVICARTLGVPGPITVGWVMIGTLVVLSMSIWVGSFNYICCS